MKISKLLAIAVLLFAFTLNADAQTLKTPAPSPLQTIDQAFGLGNIKIEYSRPSVKGRKVFGDLVPFGKVWRTGANSASKITFGDTVKVEGNSVNPGTYALYTVPNNGEWEIMLYKDLTLGGNVGEYKKEDELLRFKVKEVTSAEKVETFTINVADVTSNSANIQLMWDNSRIAFKVATDVDTRVMKNIDSALEKDGRPYFAAANYYYDNNKDLKKALEWADLAYAQNPKGFFIVHLKAKIQMKMKDYQGAMKSAEKSMEIAKAEKNDDYVKLNEKLIAEAKTGGVK